MKQSFPTVYNGSNAQVGEFLVNRLLPGHTIGAVGPIVFLDHIYPRKLASTGESVPKGDFAHPHRGIATFSYVFSGKLTHYDSRGHRNTIGAGGVQWMKAGNGIIHDEQPFTDQASGNIFHSLQFWINLPPEVKTEDPEYAAVEGKDVQEIQLPEGAGCLRVLLGELGTTRSGIKTFADEFIYHLCLNPRARFLLPVKENLQYGVFVPNEEIIINGASVAKSKIAIFESDAMLEFVNPNVTAADVLIFGGSPYTAPIVGEGPFVMNSRAEIAEAYRDFFAGKYGEIHYDTIT